MWKVIMGQQERWAVSWTLVFLLFGSFLSTSCLADVWCYECAFGPSPTTSDDICRPGSFDQTRAQALKCPNGCHIYIIYEFEANALSPANVSRKPNISETTRWIDEKKDTRWITFAVRQCAPKRLPKTGGCVVKEYDNMHEEKCYCDSDYCNGSANSGHESTRNTRLPSLVFFFPILSLMLTNSITGFMGKSLPPTSPSSSAHL